MAILQIASPGRLLMYNRKSTTKIFNEHVRTGSFLTEFRNNDVILGFHILN